jgi:hypothetical protein
MTEVGKTPPLIIPSAPQFREWVNVSLALLGVSAATIGKEANLSRNTVSGFLKDPAKSMHLDNAAAVTVAIRDAAAMQNKELPPCPVRFAKGAENVA